jgi:hypothetical protein
MPSITCTSYLEVSKLGAQQQRKNHYDFTMYPTFRLTWKAHIAGGPYTHLPHLTHIVIHIRIHTPFIGINNNFKRSVPKRYHIARNVPCYTDRFAKNITTYNISKLMV